MVDWNPATHDASLASFAFSIGLPSSARAMVSAGRKDVPVRPVQVGPARPTGKGVPIGELGTTTGASGSGGFAGQQPFDARRVPTARNEVSVAGTDIALAVACSAAM